jgi:hypothetical protein
LGDNTNLAKIEILSIDGNLLNQFSIPLPEEIDMKNYSAGFYNIKLIDQSGNVNFLKLTLIN